MDIYQSITDTIIDAIESGAGDPIMPWYKSSGSIPKNGTTDREYNGINVLVLWAVAAVRGYESSRWASYKQWQAEGQQVRKGEKATQIVFYKPLPKDEETGEERVVLRYSTVFNEAQLDGYTPPRPSRPPIDRLERADAIINRTGAVIKEQGDRACYIPAKDEIYMPESWRFFDTPHTKRNEAYYGVLFHELTHWTGHKSRLDRSLKHKFGDPKYAFEELIAEMGAAFCCARLRVQTSVREDHAAYIQNWLSALREDKKAIFKAAAYAQKATDYILQPH